MFAGLSEGYIEIVCALLEVVFNTCISIIHHGCLQQVGLYIHSYNLMEVSHVRCGLHKHIPGTRRLGAAEANNGLIM